MRAFLWTVSFVLAAAFEYALLPPVFGDTLPLLAAVAVSGAALLPFWAGYSGVLAAGFFEDLLGTKAAVPNILVLIFVFLSVRAFRAWSEWDEPLESVAALFLGFAFYPVGWLFTSFLGRRIFAVPAGGFTVSPLVLRDGFFFLAWIAVLGLLLIGRFKTKRARTLAHL